MMKGRQSLALRTQLLLSSCLSFLVLGFLIVFLFSRLVDSYTEKSQKYVQTVFNQFTEAIAGRLTSLDNFLVLTSNDPSLHDYIEAKTPFDRYTTYTHFNNNIRTYLGLANGVEDYMVLAPEGNSFGLPVEPGYRQDVVKFAGTVHDRVTYGTIQKFTNGNQTAYAFLAGLSVPVFLGQLVKPITVVLRVNAQSFFPEYGAFPFADLWHYFVVDRTGLVVSSNLPAAVFRDKGFSPSGSYTASKILPDFGGQVVLEVPRDFLTHDIVQTLIGTLVIYGLIFVLLLATNLLIIAGINRINAALIQSIRGIRQRGEGDPNMEIQLSGYREAKELAQEFNAMNGALVSMRHQLIDEQTKLDQLELRSKAAEYEYLMAQFNPHFLYNSFETIKGMAAVSGQAPIVAITSALSQIFRYSIKANDEVPFRDELGNAKAYLTIQSIRFAGRFTVTYPIADDALGCLVPKMLLQPLVENAIVHGLEYRSSGGELVVGASWNRQGQLEIEVRDNGIGMSPSALANLQDSLNADHRQRGPGHRAHIGLRNLRERLRLAYGTEASVILESSQIGISGTRVRVMVPIRKES